MRADTVGVPGLRRRCDFYECTRQPTYGMDGQQAKFCSSHKEEGMIDVKNCRCKHPGCTRQPNYGHEGGRAKYCSSHKLAEMVNVVSRRCEMLGCKRQVGARPVRWMAVRHWRRDRCASPTPARVHVAPEFPTNYRFHPRSCPLDPSRRYRCPGHLRRPT